MNRYTTFCYFYKKLCFFFIPVFLSSPERRSDPDMKLYAFRGDKYISEWKTAGLTEGLYHFELLWKGDDRAAGERLGLPVVVFKNKIHRVKTETNSVTAQQNSTYLVSWGSGPKSTFPVETANDFLLLLKMLQDSDVHLCSCRGFMLHCRFFFMFALN